jgi:hypothetical protein
MRIAVLIVGSIGAAWPSLAMAQLTDVCAACIAGALCDSDARSCVAECRARTFVVDPKRSACVTHCSTTQTQCGLTAAAGCKALTVCQ